MQTREEMFTAILDGFCSDGYYFENVRFEIPDGFFKKIRWDFELIVLTSKKILFFARLPDDVEREAAVFHLRAALNCLVNKLAISLNPVIVCGCNKSACFYLNKFNDRLSVYHDAADELGTFVELIENELNYGHDVFDFDVMRQLSDTLILSSETMTHSNKPSKVKVAADGTTYIRKHGVWREASEMDSEELFTVATLIGMIGGHLFYQRKYGKAVLYLLTLGLFGFGWFFDCLEMFVGIYKDPTGRYLLPLSNKLLRLALFLAGLVVFCGVSLLFIFIFKFLFNSLTETIINLA